MRDILHCSFLGSGIPALAALIVSTSFAFAQFEPLTSQPEQSTSELQLSTDAPPLQQPEIVFPTPTCRTGLVQFDIGLGQLVV